MQQSGNAPVGKSATSLMTVSVKFAQAFASAPVVVASTLQDPNYMKGINDTFAVSVVSVTTSGFTAHIMRVDTTDPKGWDQNLQLGYIATA